MKLAFKIASRFLLASKGQTILIIVGIIIGVSVQVFIGSLIDGLQRSLVDTTVGSTSQITLSSQIRNGFFAEDETLFASLAEDQRLTAISPVINGSGFVLDLETEESYPVQMRGFDYDKAEAIYKINEQLTAGEIPADADAVLIGIGLAGQTGLDVGDDITIVTPAGAPETRTIAGIFDLKVASLNENWLLLTLEGARTFFGEANEISAIEMQVDDVFAADLIAAEWQDRLAEDLKISNWKDDNAQLLSGLAGQSASSYMIQVFVLLAVLLGISSVLAISVVQKSRQIGILKAMGIKNKAASQIFLLQGFLLGLIGAALGVLLGLGLSFTFSVFVQNPDGTALVPFYFDPIFVLFSFVIAVVAATLSALIPARKSSKLNPIEVIKNG